MNDNTPNKNQALDALFWKEEILQILYWMEGEELAEAIPFTRLLALLNTSSENLLYHLSKNEEAGWIFRDTDVLNETSTFCLTTAGKKEAGLIFRKAFDGMQKAGHGECGPDCEFCYHEGKKLENCVHNCAENNTHPHNH